MGKISKQKLRAMLVSTLMNRFLLMQVAGYCLQKLKFDYFELTLNNLNAIFFTEGLKWKMYFISLYFLEQRKHLEE